MNPILAALHTECERLHGLVLRLILAGAAACLKALAKDVRALEVQLRLWIIANLSALPVKPKRTRQSETEAQRARRFAGRSAAAHRAAKQRKECAPSPFAGLRLGLGNRKPRASRDTDTANAYTPSPHDPADAEINTMIKLARLHVRLNQFSQIIENPHAALAHFARRHKRTAATETKSAPRPATRPATHPPTDHSPSFAVVTPHARRRLAWPDSS